MKFRRRLFNTFFNSLTWKILVVILYAILFSSLLYFVVIAQYSIRLAELVGSKVSQQTAEIISDAYSNGIIALFLLIVVGLVALLELLTQSRVALRYRELGEAMLKFGAGDLKVRAQVRDGGEVEQVARNFNKLADSIEKHIVELKESEKLRLEIVANLAHDLGGPLTSISGFVDTIMKKSDKIEPSILKEYLTIIKGNANSLNKIVRQLSDLASLDSKPYDLEKENFAIAPLINDVLSRYVPEAELKNVSIHKELPENLSLVCADLVMIERVLSNIIDNALCFTPSGGYISISLKELSDFIQVGIVDTGEGIAAHHLPNICTRFYRVDEDRSRATGGSGLGLAIVKEIIDAHQGTLQIFSVLGKGTTVIFTLPKA